MLYSLARNAHAWTPQRTVCLVLLLLIAAHARAQFGAQPVGVTSAVQDIQVAATTAGVISRIEILTLGSPNGDFTSAEGPSTCTPANLAIGTTCTQPVAFTPTAPGLRMGAVVLVGTLNGADTVLGVTYLFGTGMGESGTPIQENSIRGIARTEATANHEDTDTATQSLLGRNGSTAIDGNGNFYIADADHNRILMVCGSAATPIIYGTTCSAPGETSTIAGDGTAAYTGDNGPAANAALNNPSSLAFDGAGNLLIADTGNNVIRVINAVTGLISTIAGNANSAICASATNSIGDGCPAAAAILNKPQSITVYGSGSLSIADTGNKATRFVDRATSVISTLAVASTISTLTSDLDPSGFGQSVTFTVTVSAADGTGDLTGTVSLTDTYGGATTTLVSGLPLNASGTATFYLSSLAVGQHAIVASYSNANDPAHGSSTSSPLIESVLEGTAVSLTSGANPTSVGQSVTFTATVASLGGDVTPTGAINFYDGSAVLSTLTLNGSGTATYSTSALANGLHQIVAVYSGDPNAEVEGSTSPALYQDVQVPSSLSVSSSLNPSTYGAPVSFTATITSTAPAIGSVSFFDNGVSLGTGTLAGNPSMAAITSSTLSAGTHRITVAYAGDSKNQASNSSASPLNQLVQQAQTVTTISAAPASGIAGTPETFTAAVALAQGLGPLTGAVSFTSGATLLGSAQLNSSGVAVISPILAAGDYEIIATYQGNTNALGSASNVPACSTASPAFCSGSGPLPYTVAAAVTQTTLVISPTTAAAASPIVFTATVVSSGSAPAGSVNFLANGAVIGTSPLSGSAATFTDVSLPAGSYTMTAEFLGNANDGVSTSASVAETLSAIPTTTSLSSATTTGTDPEVILTATVGGSSNKLVPSGTITLMSGETLLGKAALDANGVATLSPVLVKGANYALEAVYSGDAFYGSSTSQTISVAGVASGFTVSVTPSSATVSSAQDASVAVTLTSVANFTDTVVLSCASLPATVNCRFTSTSLHIPAGGTARTQLTIGTGNAKTGTDAMISRANAGRFSLAQLFLPFSFAFGWWLLRLRRSSAHLFSIAPLVILAAASLATTSCGAVLESAASQGNYVIQVTGSGATTNVVRSQNVHLNVAR